MTNVTLRKFGFPDRTIRRYEHWCVLLRPAQATLGSLVLGALSEVESFAQLLPQAFAELAIVIPDIELGLKAFRAYDRINYLMLMMVDPNVHFHVLPRYRAAQEFAGMSFPDKGWPGQPDLSVSPVLTPAQSNDLRDAVRSHWRVD